MATTTGVFLLRPTFAGVSLVNRSTASSLYLALRFISGKYTAGAFQNDSAAFTTKKVIKPRGDVPLVDPQTGMIAISWDRYFDYIDAKLGGPLGPSVKDTQTNVVAVQKAVSTQAAIITDLTQQATSNAESLAATIEVAKLNNLDKADQIPPAKRHLMKDY
jgi:hypothetical protein